MKGIALEGGASRGAYHMGVLRALYEKGYKIDGITGTSIGAFNAAMVAQGDFEVCYNMWKDIQPDTLFDVDRNHMEKIEKGKIDKETREYLSSEAKKIIANRGIDTAGLRKILDKYIDEDKLRASDIDFGLVTVKFDGVKPVPVEIFKEEIPYGELKDYIMASANLPVFKKEEGREERYIDGGFYDNCPIQLLERKGYDDIIAIRLFPDRKIRKPLNPNTKLVEIKPAQQLGRALVFSNNTIRKNMLRGYFDAIKYFEGLKGKKYYIEPISDDEFFERIINYPEKNIIQFGEKLNISEMDPKRMLFEKIIPKVASLVKADESESYQDIFIGLMEILAEERKLKKFKIYTLDEFVNEIKEIEPPEEDEKNKDFLSVAMKLMKPIESKISSRKTILKEFEKEILSEISYDE